MQEYHVVWDIDVVAKNEREAAEIALEMQRDPDSIATIFKVGKKNNIITKYKEIDVR
jgi:hypothetical protein